MPCGTNGTTRFADLLWTSWNIHVQPQEIRVRLNMGGIGQPKIHWLIMFPPVKLQIWGISIPSWTNPHYVRQHGLLTSDTSGSAVNHKHSWSPQNGVSQFRLTAQQEPHSSRASSRWRQHQRSDSWRMELAWDWLSLRVRPQGIHPWDPPWDRPWDPKGGIITSLGWRASGCWYERGMNQSPQRIKCWCSGPENEKTSYKKYSKMLWLIPSPYY